MPESELSTIQNSFPVSRDTDPTKLAGAIAKSFVDGRDVVMAQWGKIVPASLSHEETDSGTKITMFYKAAQQA